MPQCEYYIQSLSHPCSVRSLVESGNLYRQIFRRINHGNSLRMVGERWKVIFSAEEKYEKMTPGVRRGAKLFFSSQQKANICEHVNNYYCACI
jgi:hypothetical protein